MRQQLGGIVINLVEFSSFIISFFGTSRMPYPTIGGSFVFGYRRRRTYLFKFVFGRAWKTSPTRDDPTMLIT